MTDTAGAVVGLAVFFIVGVACVVAALWFGWRDFQRARTWCVAEGEVVGHVEVPGGGDGPSFRTVVEFRDMRGELIRVRSSWQSSPPRYRVGQGLRVCYEAGRPHKAQIIGENRWILISVGILGLIFAGAAGAMMAHVLVYGLPVQ